MKLKFTNQFFIFALTGSTLFAQTGKKIVHSKIESIVQNQTTNLINGRGCLFQAPSVEWEDALQKLIEQRNSETSLRRVNTSYSIPIVIHIIHGGQALGTYPNISNAQAISQINILNNDYAGIGLNYTTYPATAFTSYATAASLPAANKDASNRVKISNFNISFCAAAINPAGAAMSEIGIDRVNYSTFTLSAGYTSKDPANSAYNSISTFQSFIDNIVKPQTIWDPTKYMNIWITDTYSSVGLLGYATFPIGVTLTGISGSGTATTDGVWCLSSAFGNTGSATAPYDKGRTATHEIGHWLGLRHIWGDGACATDYCLDTSPASAANTAGPYTYPYLANTCTSPSGVNNTIPNGANGEMYMNFMDYSYDNYMYMFTEDQRTRAQTVMANGTYRKFLGTHGLCSTSSSTPAVAAMTITNTACAGTAIIPTNSSTGSPTPTYTWSSVPSVGVSFSPSANVTTPNIIFASTGTYTITLAAKSGTTAVSTKMAMVTVSSCTVATVCSKTITNISNTDTMYIANAGADVAVTGCSPKAGYIFGSNCYDDLEKAEFFTPATYSSIAPGPALVTGAIVVYFKNGTRGTGGAASTAVNLKMYNGTMAAGPGATALGTATANIGLITSTTPTNSLGYLAGNPALTYSPSIAIPYKYTFSSPITAPAGGFFLGVTLPTAAGDTAVIMNDFHATSNSSWEKFSGGTWNDMNVSWPGLVNNMAIFPLVTCSVPTSLDASNVLVNNVNIMPNPSTGLFNVVITLDLAQDITVNVTNMLGQTILVENHKAFTNGVLPIDLSNHNQGIYFITVSNGINKNIQRIVLTK